MTKKIGKKKLLGVIAGFSAAIFIAGASGYTFATNMYEADKMPLAEMPIINKDATTDYKKGSISRETALQKIEEQLITLEDSGNISAWKYTDASGRYDVTLNNGTKFTYYLN